jgi:hypothetical protein
MPVSTWRAGRGVKEPSAIRVELDEDEVPDFDALGSAFVDERAAGVVRRG